MRPNQRQPNDSQRYRRSSNNGRSTFARIAVIMIVAVGIVGVSVILANNYEFNSANETSQTRADNTDNRGQSGDGSTVTADLLASADGSISGNPSGSSDIEPDFPDSTGPGGSKTGSVDGDSGNTGEATSCSLTGRVTDDWGAPMIGTLIRAMNADEIVAEVVTNDRGRYQLPNSVSEVTTLSVILTHGTTTTSTFSVMNGDQPISLDVTIDYPGSTCEVNFDAWKIQDHMKAAPIETELWPDATTVYQNTVNAEALALNLGADFKNTSPLQIKLWNDDKPSGYEHVGNSAYFIAENELEPGSPPIISVPSSKSSATLPGVPDNREYHEYGHYFLALQTGDNFTLPANDQNHGGYYQNTSTRDSFVEGFAEFYSVMVSRHVDGDVKPEIYTIGADYDLEVNRLPWEFEGWWEEFTIAGLLLDLVDNDSDYTSRANDYSGMNVTDISTEISAGGTIVSGKVVNTSPLVVRQADVTVRYLNDSGEVVGTQVTRILPGTIAPTREGTFYAAPPEGLGVTGATATLGGISRTDDDNVSMDLLRLMRIITEYERTGDDVGSMGVSNVAELYDALANEISESSGGSAGVVDISASQIDEIFVNHGFYADLDGDHVYNPELDGEIGISSHPSTDVNNTSYPAFIPRQDPDPFAGSLITIDTGAEGIDAIVQISMPANGGANSYAYVSSLDGTNQVELAIPPADHNAQITIITAGKNYKPVIAYRVDADDFHEKIENGSISELQVVPVELEPGTVIAKPGVSSKTIQSGIIIGGIIALLLVVASLATIHRQWGKS